MNSARLRRPLLIAATALAVAIAVVVAFDVTRASSTPAAHLRALATVAAPNTQASLRSISPDHGSLAGGEKVTLIGKNLAGVTAVTFGANKVSELQHVDDTTITLAVPSVTNYVASAVTVAVSTTGQSDPNAAGLTYTYQVETNVDRQMQYLFTYWDNYNVAQYGDFNDIGGDCANFVSQSLVARGWAMTDDWYSYDGGSSWGGPWGYVPDLDDWLSSHPETGATELSLQQRDQVKVGDLVIFDWDNDGSRDHVQVVSSVAVVDGVTKIEMVGHNTDSDYRDLDTAITVDHPGATAHFWSLP
ncbi:MAG: amidase domain-containing protein [Rhodoglobus sp.]